MAGLEKVEGYLIDLGIRYEDSGDNTWLVEDEEKGIPAIVISLADPVLLIRANVMRIPANGRESLYHELLSLNASGLVHGAYAIEGDEVILVDSLQYGSLDRIELEAALEAITLGLREHYPLLSRFVPKQ